MNAINYLYDLFDFQWIHFLLAVMAAAEAEDFRRESAKDLGGNIACASKRWEADFWTT